MDARPPLLRPEPGPRTLKVTPWGGRRLARLRGAASEYADATVGESWEFSTLPGHESLALGRPLSAVLGGPLPFLAKLIDTATPLSVQVHPDDDAATGTPGKEEAWIILDAEPGARVLAGLAPGVDAPTLARAVSRANADPSAHGRALLSCLRSVPVRAGMVVLIPARTVHAIGGGILLAEIQQPSDCTYRLHDYGSERPIHVERALATLDPAAQPRIWDPAARGPARSRLHGKHLRLDVLGPGRHELLLEVDPAPPLLLIAQRGACQIGARETLAAGELALALAGPLALTVEGQVVAGTLAR
ncbi:MAG: class I mannose-6-phosphate isomerase [Myxococcales bacterium]|nr:class I mannose-6-phosphate isomerase [Myxococcales bacterium]